MEIQNRFNVHKLNTVNSARHAGYNLFYDSYAEAEKMATKYARDSGEPMVIYEARVVVAPATVPVTITTLEPQRIEA